MNLEEILTNKFEPTHLITIYRSNNKDFYLEQHSIEQRNGRYIPMEGSPITNELIIDLTQKIKVEAVQSTQCEGLLNNIIYVSNEVANRIVIWHSLPALRKLEFKEELNIMSGLAPVPQMLFVLKNNSLYAFTINGAVNEKTKLFEAPFHNIYDSGKVCLGNVKTGSNKAWSYQKLAEKFESYFWASTFTNSLSTRKVSETPLAILWNEIIKKGPLEKFPSNELIEHSKYKTINELLKSLK